MSHSALKKIALIDLDGTMADYDNALQNGLQRLAKPGEDTSWFKAGVGFNRESLEPWQRERERLVRSADGFYRNLDPISMGFRVLELLLHCGFTCHIASKCPSDNSAQAAKEKIEWCASRASLRDLKVTICGDKSLMMGAILFDDWPGYITPWLENNLDSVVLMLDQPWNANFNHERVVRVKNCLWSNPDPQAIEIERIKKELIKFGLITEEGESCVL
jgi:5'(3')-deoxyribonucleotidase